MTSDDRRGRVSLYAERGYVDGLELEDWLQAEAEVDRGLGGQRATH